MKYLASISVRFAPLTRTRLVFGLLLIGFLGLSSAQAAPPKIKSFFPANGATGVAADAEWVIVFDQAMDTSVSAVPSFPPLLVGNLTVSPQGIVLIGEWDEDGLTLRLRPSSPLPTDTQIQWTLNPANRSTFVPPFQSEAQEALALVSGGFKTGGAGNPTPGLESVSPADGEMDVDPSSAVTFVFDQTMDISVAPIANSGQGFVGNVKVTPALASFTGTWGPDGKSLRFVPVVPLPSRAVISWTLNPAGTAFPLKSASGVLLPTLSGSFTVGSGSSTNAETCVGNSDGTGFFSFNKGFWYQQEGTSAPVPRTGAPNYVSVQVSAPDAGPAVTAGSLTLPNASRKNLDAFGTLFVLNGQAADEAALDAAYPPGAYTLRFTQTGQPERVVPMSLPASPTTIPRIANLNEAQSVDSTKAFTLGWNSFSAAGAGNSIFLIVSDAEGRTVFMAPNPCRSRILLPTATSVEIPAGTLTPGQSYDCLLQFGKTFFSSTNAVPKFSGHGQISRATAFTLQTRSSDTTPPAAARFVDYRLLANGHPQLTLTGTPSAQYMIMRAATGSAPQWVEAGTVTMNAQGQAVFEDLANISSPRRFYRAVSQ